MSETRYYTTKTQVTIDNAVKQQEDEYNFVSQPTKAKQQDNSIKHLREQVIEIGRKVVGAGCRLHTIIHTELMQESLTRTH